LRSIAGRFAISDTSLCRHKQHVAGTIQTASRKREEDLGESLLDELQRMNRKAWELLAKAEAEGDYRGAIVALRVARECIEAQEAMLSRAGSGGPVQIDVRVVALGR
jgi:hypothetical protein